MKYTYIVESFLSHPIPFLLSLHINYDNLRNKNYATFATPNRVSNKDLFCHSICYAEIELFQLQNNKEKQIKHTKHKIYKVRQCVPKEGMISNALCTIRITSSEHLNSITLQYYHTLTSKSQPKNTIKYVLGLGPPPP